MSLATVSLSAVADHLAGVAGWPLALAFALHVANHLLRSLAWRGVLAAAYPERRVPLLDVAGAYASGVALNAVTPARGGDAVKIGILRARLPGSSVATLAASMSVLVLFDVVAATLLVLAVGLAGVVPLAPRVPSAAAAPGWVADHAVVVVPVALAVAGVVTVVLLRAADRVRGQLALARQGGAILRTPRRYLTRVAVVQACAWCCRIGVVLCLLAAFALPVSVPVAGLVMVLAGASTVVPLTPGGAGTQQVLVTLALSHAASAATVLSFSVGMQAGVTLVNALLGVVAAMVIGRSVRPVAAVRAGLRLARAPA